MTCAEKVDGIFKQGQHFVAALDASGMIFYVRATEIRTCHIDGLQKIFNAAIVINAELIFHLLDRNLQAPYHIPIFFEQFPGVVIAGILLRPLFKLRFCHDRTLLPLRRLG